MKQKIIAVCVLPIFISGCAGMDSKSKSATLGAAFGCAAGAILANISGHDAAGGCAAGALVGGIVGYEKARQDELNAAKLAQQNAVSSLPGAQAGEVVADNISVTEKATGQVKQVQVFREANIDLPLSKKGTPEFNSAMDKLKAFAEKVADERGKSEIIVSLAPNDAKAQKVSAEKVEFKTASGKGTVLFSKAVDDTIKTGVERVTVRAANSNKVEI